MITTELDDTVERLEAEGADPLRLELLGKARRFKRSWIDMAEALARVQDSRAYEGWGYPTLHAYCEGELLIKRRTVDKLLSSFVVVSEHVPDLLARDGVERPVPSLDAVSYFADAMGGRGGGEPPDHPPDLVDTLRAAVFDDDRPVGSIRREFGPQLYPMSAEDHAARALQEAHASVRRLFRVLPTVAGLSQDRVQEVAETLQRLQADLEEIGGQSTTH